MSNYDNVYNFHEKYGLLHSTKPRQLTTQKLQERLEFLWEELHEFADASGFVPVEVEATGKVKWHGDFQEKDLAEQADALIDLVYVAMGTGVMMGLPWQQLWEDVQRANMSKVRGTTKRGHAVDVTKPEGWVGPDAGAILQAYGFDPEAEEVDDELL